MDDQPNAQAQMLPSMILIKPLPVFLALAALFWLFLFRQLFLVGSLSPIRLIY